MKDKRGNAVEKPLISIIVPVYNSEKYVETSVSSICDQTIQNIQIILVDDGSTDQSVTQCQKLAETDKRIEVYGQTENRGVSAARNKGLSYARGEYILFVDADDKIDKDMIELLLSPMEEDSEIDLSVCGYYIDDMPQISKREKKATTMGRLEAAKEATGWNGSLVKGYAVNKLFRRKKIEECGLRFDEDTHICEDLLFCQQYILNSRKVIYNPQPKYHYITRAGSAMHSKVTEKRMTVLETYPKILECGYQYGDAELNELLEIGYWNHYVSILKDVVKNPSREQKAYGDQIFPYIRERTGDFLKSRHTTFKRKVLIVGLRTVYPIWRLLPFVNRQSELQ